MGRTFGCTSSSSGSGMAMVVNSITKRSSAEKAQARGTTGKVTDETFYSRERSHQASGLIDGTHTVLAGASITVAGLTAIVSEESKQETNTGYQTCDVTVTKADGATQVPYSS